MNRRLRLLPDPVVRKMKNWMCFFILVLFSCQGNHSNSVSRISNSKKDSVSVCIKDFELANKIILCIDSVKVEDKYQENLKYCVCFTSSGKDTLIEISPVFGITSTLDTETKEVKDYFKGYFKLKDKLVFVYDEFENGGFTNVFFDSGCLTKDASCEKYFHSWPHRVVDFQPYQKIIYKYKDHQLQLFKTEKSLVKKD